MRTEYFLETLESVFDQEYPDLEIVVIDDFDRLDALPHARLCIKCKAKEEDDKRR